MAPPTLVDKCMANWLILAFHFGQTDSHLHSLQDCSHSTQKNSADTSSQHTQSFCHLPWTTSCVLFHPDCPRLGSRNESPQGPG